MIVAHAGPGPISVPAAYLRQARIAHRRGESERAVMFARRASHEAPKDDPVYIEARAFLDGNDAAPAAPRPRR